MARLGIVLHHGIEKGPELAGYGRLAERARFESLWVTERYFHEETFSLLGFLAAVTDTIKLGLGVANPFTRHPALLAMASATLDRLSDGRLLLGLGRSDREVIRGKMGLPYRNARATLEAAVTLVRQLHGGDEVDTTHGPFTMRGARLAVTPADRRVPIYLAAIGPRALALAGTVADGVLLNAYVPTAYVRWAVEEVRRAARAARRDPSAIDVACMLVVRPTDDVAAVRPALKQRLVRLFAEPHVGEILLERGGFDPSILGPLRTSPATALDLVSDEMVDAFHLVGPAEHLNERIAAYRAAGVDLPLLLPRLEDYRRVVETLAP